MFEYPPAKHNIYHLRGVPKQSTQKCPKAGTRGYVSILGGYRFFFSTFFSLRAFLISLHEAAVRLSAAGAAFLRKRPEDQEVGKQSWKFQSNFGGRPFSWSSEAKAESSLIPRKFLFASILFWSDFFQPKKVRLRCYRLKFSVNFLV